MTWNGAGAWLIFSQSRQVELLPHRLDHLPLTRHQFQRAGHVLAELAQAIAAAALTRRRRIDHHALAGKMVRERIALGALARKSAHRRRLGDRLLRRKFVFRGVGLQLFECKRQLVDQPRRALRSLAVDLALQLGDPQVSAAAISALSSDAFATRFASASRVTANASFSAAMSSGRASRSASMKRSRIINSVICGAPKCATSHIFFGSARALSAATSVADCASRSLPAYRPSAPPRSTPHRLTPRAR